MVNEAGSQVDHSVGAIPLESNKAAAPAPALAPAPAQETVRSPELLHSREIKAELSKDKPVELANAHKLALTAIKRAWQADLRLNAALASQLESVPVQNGLAPLLDSGLLPGGEVNAQLGYSFHPDSETTVALREQLVNQLKLAQTQYYAGELQKVVQLRDGVEVFLNPTTNAVTVHFNRDASLSVFGMVRQAHLDQKNESFPSFSATEVVESVIQLISKHRLSNPNHYRVEILLKEYDPTRGAKFQIKIVDVGEKLGRDDTVIKYDISSKTWNSGFFPLGVSDYGPNGDAAAKLNQLLDMPAHAVWQKPARVSISR